MKNRTLDPAGLRDRLAGPDAPLMVDVRSPAEFTAAHIPGSYHVPLDTLREHRAEQRRRTGNRAATAERALAEAGMSNVHVLDGGSVDWERAGSPLTRGRASWDLERQVRLVAGGLVMAGVLGSLVIPELKWPADALGARLTQAGRVR